jgi:hypothetical protein
LQILPIPPRQLLCLRSRRWRDPHTPENEVTALPILQLPNRKIVLLTGVD